MCQDSYHRVAESLHAGTELSLAATAVCVAQAVECGGVIHLAKMRKLVAYYEVREFFRQEYKARRKRDDTRRRATAQP